MSHGWTLSICPLDRERERERERSDRERERSDRERNLQPMITLAMYQKYS